MKLIIVITLLLTLTNKSRGQEFCVNKLPVHNKFINNFLNKKFDSAIVDFDKMMLASIKVDDLNQIYSALTTKYGKFNKSNKVIYKINKGYCVLEDEWECTKANVIIRTVYSSDTTLPIQISGLYFQEKKIDSSHALPAYINEKTFTKIDTVLDNKGVKLNVSLTIPNGILNGAALIILGGSGPTDKNGSIGNNKPYRDLAYGLSSRGGVIVLRFDKRVLSNPVSKDNSISFNEEYIDDALFLLDYIKKQSAVDTSLIYVLGHSLGVKANAKLASLNIPICGFINMCGSPREIEDLVEEQVNYIYKYKGIETAKDSTYQKFMQQISYMKYKLNTNSPTDSLLFNTPASYYLDLKKINVVDNFKKSNYRLLFLHGGRDYHVSEKDINIFKDELKNKADFKIYQDLNHLLMPGTNKSTPDEYNESKVIVSSVIEDIYNWIFNF